MVVEKVLKWSTHCFYKCFQNLTSVFFCCIWPVLLDLESIYFGDSMAIRILGSIIPGKYVGRGNFCVVGCIIKPNQLRDFKRESIGLKFLRPPWIAGIYEGLVTLFILLSDTFKANPHYEFIIHNNIYNNHHDFWCICLTNFSASITSIPLLLTS